MGNSNEFEVKLLQTVDTGTDDAIAVWFGVMVCLFIVAWALGSSAKMVRPTERGLVERFGKYHHFVKAGLTFLIPFADHIIRVNITERMSQVQPQEVITKDKVVMQVDAVIFFKVKPDEESVKASEYNVSNFQTQIEVLARTTLRNIIGTLEMAEANVSREKINASLKEQLTLQSQTWGIDVLSAELKDLVPPKDLQESMTAVLKANNQKLAAIDLANAVETQADGQKRAIVKQAEGDRQAQILRAEAQKQATILESEGTQQATVKIAQGDAEATKLRNEALTSYFKGSAITYQQLQTITTSLQNNSKIIVPQGNAVSLILSELDAARKILPIQPNTHSAKEQTQDSDKT
jgi:regulator of protease activity HflC (stomatin/prohibitin superfamily)